jgi:cell division protein YceG involved in septum cleavage
MEAAAHPARVDYLYYVAKGDSGRHFFTRSYDEFLAHGGGG